MNTKHLHTVIRVSLLTLLVVISLSTSVFAQQQGTMGNSSNGGGTLSNSSNGGGTLTGSSNTQTPVFYLQNPLDSKFNTVGGIVTGFIDIFTYLVILFAVLMIIYVGLRFVLAQGNVEELKERKNQLLWLLVGVAIVIGARVLISAVINTLEATGVVNPGVINSAKNGIGGQ